MSAKIILEGDFTYTIENGTAKLCSYNGSNPIVNIPKTLGGYSVTSIGDSAFYGCKNVTTIEIPNSVTSIGETAFAKCFGVTEITLSENHPVYSFFDGALLNKANGVLLSYFGDKSLSSYVIPNFVTTIAHGAFMDCTTLKEVVISDGVTSIEKMAFYRCKNVTTITFGNSVMNIDRGAFCGCRKLKEVVLPTSVVSFGDWAFESCKCLERVLIPTSVTSIGKEAFKGCSSLREVVLPKSVISIGKGAFDSRITTIRKKASHGVWRDGVFREWE